ncbi:HepT-like ribonuclease domain-containing protein [Methanolobus sp. ZRKC5]
MIHVYFGVDLEEVWNTITKDIPDLKMAVQNILNNAI